MVISACKPAEAPPAAQLGEEEEEGGGLARLTGRLPSVLRGCDTQEWTRRDSP